MKRSNIASRETVRQVADKRHGMPVSLVGECYKAAGAIVSDPLRFAPRASDAPP